MGKVVHGNFPKHGTEVEDEGTESVPSDLHDGLLAGDDDDISDGLDDYLLDFDE